MVLTIGKCYLYSLLIVKIIHFIFCRLKYSLYICIEFKNTLIMSNFKTVEEAKAYLTEQGFYTGNLWSVQDVQDNYDCTQEEAQEVLDGALQNEATMEQIWYAINYHAQESGLERKETFSIGESVEVPDPNDSDIHNHSFVGVIVGFRDNGNAVVEDGDGDCFEIEVERLTLI